MISPVFLQAGSNRSPFHQFYLEALRAIFRCDDEAAGGLLNEVARHLEPDDTEAEIGMIKVHVAVYIDALRGDHQYAVKNPSPWIKNARVHALIADHIKQLGNETDVEAYNAYAQKCSAFFKQPYEVIAPAPTASVA